MKLYLLLLNKKKKKNSNNIYIILKNYDLSMAKCYTFKVCILAQIRCKE